VASTRLQLHADRRSAAKRRELAAELQRLADDAGLTQVALARAAGISRSYLSRIFAEAADPTLETYQRLASVLGAELSMRFYPSTGSPIRDRHQAPMLEHLLGVRHPRWDAFTEVAVRRPSRGWIDLVLLEPRERTLLATELQSEIRRLEQLVRWHAAKADSLPSWDGFAHLAAAPRIGRLLVVRRTRATRRVVAEFARQLRIAYPAHPDDAVSALTGTVPWPGDALVWMTLDRGEARLAAGR
jgi:transcriptional regulator with XRE-family HTH domain